MSSLIIEHRFRLFMLSLAAVMAVGTVVELWFAEHLETLIQYIPFILCGLAFLAIMAVLLRPRCQTILGLRVVMGLVALGSFFGLFQHLEHNIEFALEIQPNATVSQVFGDALRGANPLLAPGILALVAIIAAAATYQHPSLGGRSDE